MKRIWKAFKELFNDWGEWHVFLLGFTEVFTFGKNRVTYLKV